MQEKMKICKKKVQSSHETFKTRNKRFEVHKKSSKFVRKVQNLQEKFKVCHKCLKFETKGSKFVRNVQNLQEKFKVCKRKDQNSPWETHDNLPTLHDHKIMKSSENTNRKIVKEAHYFFTV